MTAEQVDLSVSGVYGIRSLVHPERVYIGSAVNIRKRWEVHLSNLRKGKHHSLKLQRHYDKYKIKDLIFELIMSCDTECLIKAEQTFIDLYKPCFNMCPTAGSSLGIKRSENTKSKLSKIAKDRKPASLETRAKISKANSGEGNALYGKHHSRETREKMSRAARARAPMSDETREKIGTASRERKRVTGKHPSEEARKNMSKAHKDPSKETREKMSRATTGPNNPFYGKHHTPETKIKMRKPRKKHRARKGTMEQNIEQGVE